MLRFLVLTGCLLAFGATLTRAELRPTLPLPTRDEQALTGSQLANDLSDKPLAEREQRLVTELLAGNVPNFLRVLQPIGLTNIAKGIVSTGLVFVAADYLAVGSDTDYLLAPLTPQSAQKIADALGCSLPTKQLVDVIYQQATVKLTPSPIPPTAAMTTLPVFAEHNATVRTQRDALASSHPQGELVAGHKKDVVLTPRLTQAPGKVAIYGWHKSDGKAIQPLYLGHTDQWVDYSHGIRLVNQQMVVNGQPTTYAAVLKDESLTGLLSDEGALSSTRYEFAQASVPTTTKNSAATKKSDLPLLDGFVASPYFDEQISEFTFEPEVRVLLNAPGPDVWQAKQPIELVLYGLPNGNTIEQTIGRQTTTGDDWHFNIQHIGAQTRFVRERIKNRNIVVAYLETKDKSWPAWRRSHANESELIHALVNEIQGRLPKQRTTLTLSGHSGGGSMIFGYLNGVKRIPREVTRITFLDSNYAYDPAQGHATKLAQWLKSSKDHYLCGLAYNDGIALLDGKSFVTPTGGTWFRTQLLIADLVPLGVKCKHEVIEGFQNYYGQDRRVQFRLKENPDRVIYHTVQVEKNGFIHCLLSGTELEEKDYQYFGTRAYDKFIQPRDAQ